MMLRYKSTGNSQVGSSAHSKSTLAVVSEVYTGVSLCTSLAPSVGSAGRVVHTLLGLSAGLVGSHYPEALHVHLLVDFLLVLLHTFFLGIE